MKKLTLNKKTITNLNNEDLNNVKGGNMWYTDPRDCGPTQGNNTCGGGGGGTTIVTNGCNSQITCFTQCAIATSCIC